MPEIRIAYDLPSFKYCFEWDGTEAEAAHALATGVEILTGHGLDPRTALPQFVAQAPATFAGADAKEIDGAHLFLTAWALQSDSGHPEYPGRVIDYLPTFNFEFVIKEIRGREVSFAVTAKARDDFAGEA